jgi:RimJ/RimL family protein N-acetyltransferase
MAAAPGPIIETERLILRPTALEDFDAWADFMAHEASRFVGGPVPRSTAWRGCMTMAGSWTLQGFGMFSVIEKAGGRWVGRVGPWRPDSWPGDEVGWGIVPDCHRMGYATEAAAAAMDFAVDRLGWTDIIHCIDPANGPSQGVARRLGSTILREARMPPPFDEHVVDIWGQSGAQWRENRKRLGR